MVKLIIKNLCIPQNVSILFKNRKIIVIGPFGKLGYFLPSFFSIKIYTNNNIDLVAHNSSKKLKQLEPVIFSLIKNMIVGVSEQFTIILELRGIGYRCKIENNFLILTFSYSTIKKLKIPLSLQVHIESITKIFIRGIDKEKVTLFASIVRYQRIPEPYKGKGIFYLNETIKLKKGKH